MDRLKASMAGALLALTISYSEAAPVVSTPLPPHKDGVVAAQGVTVGKSEELRIIGSVDQSGRQIGWITYAAGNVDFSQCGTVVLALHVRSVSVGGQLLIGRLDQEPALKNQPTYAELNAASGLVPPVAITVQKTDEQKVLRIDVTGIAQSTLGFHGFVLRATEPLDVSLSSNQSDSKPVLQLAYSSFSQWVDGDGQVRTDEKVGIGKNPETELDVHGTVTAKEFVGHGKGITGAIADSIPDGAVTTEKLMDGAVTRDKIHNYTIDSTKIAFHSIAKSNFAIRSVGRYQIDSGAVHHENIEDWAVDSTKIANGSVTTDKLSDDLAGDLAKSDLLNRVIKVDTASKHVGLALYVEPKSKLYVEDTALEKSSKGIWSKLTGDSSIAIYGSTPGKGGVGIFGTSDGKDGIGVRGSATDTGGVGVHGYCVYDNGIGVLGTGKKYGGSFRGQEDGIGIFAKQGPNGTTAAVFQGDVAILNQDGSDTLKLTAGLASDLEKSKELNTILKVNQDNGHVGLGATPITGTKFYVANYTADVSAISGCSYSNNSVGVFGLGSMYGGSFNGSDKGGIGLFAKHGTGNNIAAVFQGDVAILNPSGTDTLRLMEELGQDLNKLKSLNNILEFDNSNGHVNLISNSAFSSILENENSYSYSIALRGSTSGWGSVGMRGDAIGNESKGVLGSGHIGVAGYGDTGICGNSEHVGGSFNGMSNGIGLRAQAGNFKEIAAVFAGKIVVVDKDEPRDTLLQFGKGLDYAEGFAISRPGTIKPGTVLIVDPENPGKLSVSNTPYDTKVAGIVAGANNLGSGVRLGSKEFDHSVALAGRVYCNVDASQSSIEPGDLLTTSTVPGYAMKVQDHDRAQGAVLGKAMERLAKGERKQIMVLVTLQ